MILKKLSYKARVLICAFIQVLLGIFLTFGLGKSIGFLFCFLILALMCFISAFFGKNPTTRIKKISKKAYKNSKKFSAILGLVFLFLGLVDMITSPKSGSNFLYLDTGLIFLLLPE
ncbi:hypothetical protein LDX54_02885 [Lactobacillus sp. IBH004]|uniref:hypothetical protein n=1 Tax=Lactobacillus TaxID=1578 RepID=UPI001581079E|nr:MULTISPECIES: hypothetical protein [Lactobacillus]NUE98274.1 hypothetical protein [Lactobacillus melliventris]UZN42513.1 hypothetical protein LDX54_02885 [Lactobacillus sp. IBH004]